MQQYYNAVKEYLLEAVTYLKANWQNPPVAFGVGLMLIIGGYYTYTTIQYTNWDWPFNDTVNEHADFAIYIKGEQHDFSALKYQLYRTAERDTGAYLRDSEGHVLRRTHIGVTFAEFLHTMGFTLTNSCLTTDTGEHLCEDDRHILALYVNGEVTPHIMSYVPEDGDRILLYYGIIDNVRIHEQLLSVTDKACIYSGTCPERRAAAKEVQGNR